MARILYGICSVGIGHAVRSSVVLAHLQKNNELFIVASHKAYDYLKPRFKNVHTIEGFELAFKKNTVLSLRTLFRNARKLTPETYKRLNIIEEKIRAFKPDLAISDWETFSSIIAKKNNIPLISIDNGHYIRFGDYPFPYTHAIQYLKALIILKLLMKKANMYLVMLLPGMHLKYRKNVYSIDPIVRNEIRNVHPTSQEYIIVYQSTKSYEKLLTILKQIKHKFIIYGFEKNEKKDNLIFKKFDGGKGFIQDLANAKALITNGGFTLISEALYLHKPILAVPVKKHFEQYLNASYVQKHHYGEMHTNLTKEIVEKFIRNSPHYSPRAIHWTNKKLFAALDEKTV